MWNLSQFSAEACLKKKRRVRSRVRLARATSLDVEALLTRAFPVLLIVAAAETTLDPTDPRSRTTLSPTPLPRPRCPSYSEKDFVLRTLHSFATVCVISAAIAALLPACGSSDDPTPGGTAGAGSVAGASGSTAGATNTAGASNAGTGDATKGKAVYTTGACNTCHADDGKGSQGPNITPSKTAGIGSWTYQQFHDAMRTGKAEDGTQLCTLMPLFAEKDISEASMQDLWAYVKSFPVSDVEQKGSYVTMGFCPAR